MTDDDIDLGGNIQDATNTNPAPQPGTDPGFGGLMDRTVHPGATHNPTPSEILGTNRPANPTGPASPAITGNVTIVDPAAMRQVIKIYDDEIEALTKGKLPLERLKLIEPPGDEFVSQGFVERNKAAALSAIEAYQSFIDYATNYRDMLAATLAQYEQTEQNNADDLKYKG